MKSRLVTLAALLALPWLAGTGCEKKSHHDSQIPWATPASWEGGLPGMTPDQRR